jgi:glycosyltransferase involved in cell wall biosynthesis
VFNHPSDFPARVDELLADDGLKDALRKKSLHASRKYTVQEFGKRTEEFYRQVQRDFFRPD